MTQTRKWMIGTAIAVVVIIAAGWFLLAKPQKSKVANLKEQTAAQESANNLLLTQISALQAEQKELPQQQLILQKFSTEVPDTAAEPTLIRQLSSAANGAGVTLSSITPGVAVTVTAPAAAGAQTLGGTTTAAPSLLQLPFSLGVSGTYANIESFFHSLELLPRALLVNSFNIANSAAASPAASTQNLLAATLNAAVFYAPGTLPLPVVTPTAPATPDTSTTPAATTAPVTPATPADTGSTPAPDASVSRPPIPLNPLNN